MYLPNHNTDRRSLAFAGTLCLSLIPFTMATLLMLTLNSIEPQRAYKDNEQVRLCTSLERSTLPRIRRLPNSPPFLSLSSCASSRETPLLLSYATPSTHIPSPTLAARNSPSTARSLRSTRANSRGRPFQLTSTRRHSCELHR